MNILLLFLSFFLLLLTTTTTTTSSPPPPPTTTLGITYTPHPTLPPPDQVATTLLHSLHISSVRLPSPTPSLIRSFSYTNISLLLSLPNSIIPSFSSNLSAPSLFITTHILPFYPRSKITIISLGDDVITSNSVNAVDSLLPAMRNLHLALQNLGIKTISISTTFNFVNIMTTAFPPSKAEFQDPIGSLLIKPLLSFLDDTNSYFLVNIYPYNVYKIQSEIPIGYALFEEEPYNFRDDLITGVRYRNLYDMMVDSVVAAMAVMGYENVPIIVAETGWPCGGGGEREGYGEMYVKGLVKHLRSGKGTPLRKEGAAEAYIYQLFDGGERNGTGGGEGEEEEEDWGIMYKNMSLKYKIDFKSGGGGRIVGGKGFWLVSVVLLILTFICSLC